MDAENERKYSDDEYIALSFIAQYLYCPRRAALMMLEQQWQENVYTTEGALQHEHVHEEGREMRRDLIKLTSIPLVSTRLGLSGMTDCLELIADDHGVSIDGFAGRWRVVPVEYKHGVRRNELEYEAQVCAQAICLEEMWGCVIPEGFIFYVAERRRKRVEFTIELRNKTEEAAIKLHEMLELGSTPAAVKSRRCKGCSLRDLCIPELKRNTTAYIQDLLKVAKGGEEF